MRKTLSKVAEHIHEGGLHESLGIPQGQKIGMARIEKAEHSSNPKTAAQARLAETFAHHRPGNDTAHHHPSNSYAHKGP